jgi:hypothetical protein
MRIGGRNSSVGEIRCGTFPRLKLRLRWAFHYEVRKGWAMAHDWPIRVKVDNKTGLRGAYEPKRDKHSERCVNW